MAIKKNKDGTYSIRVYVCKDDEGKQIFLRDKKESHKEAKERERELETEAQSNKGGIIKNEYKLFEKYWDEWLPLKLKNKEIEINTYNTYEGYGNNHMKPFFKGYRVGDIGKFDIKKYIAYLLDDEPIEGGIKKKKKLSSTTAAKHFYVLQEALTDALEDKNPTLYMKAPKKDDFEPVLPTEEDLNELTKIMGYGSDDDIKCQLAAWNGLCEAEIFALEWTDLFVDACKVRINKSLKKASKDEYEPGDPKTKNRDRIITIQPEVMDMLVAKRNKDKIINFNQKIFNEHPHVFADRFRYIVKKKMKKEFRFHDLRHFHASEMYDLDIPDQYAAKRLGHNVQTLKRVYQHLKKEKAQELDEKMKTLNKKKPAKGKNKKAK